MAGRGEDSSIGISLLPVGAVQEGDDRQGKTAHYHDDLWQSRSSSSFSAVGRAPILASPDEPWALSQDHRWPRATTSQRPRRRHPSAQSASPPPITALGNSATYSPPTCSGESSSSVSVSSSSSIDGARQAMSDERRAMGCPATGSRHMQHARAAVSVPYHTTANLT